MREKSRYYYIGLIALQSLAYGIMDSLAKIAYAAVPVYCFLTLRYVLAAAIMLALWHGKIISELKATPVKYYIVPSVCMAAAFIFCNVALSLTAATNAAFLRSLAALIAPLLLLIFFKKRYGAKEIILQLAMLAGLYLLCARGGLSKFGLGEIFALLSAVLVAGALVFGKQSLDYVSAETLSFVQTALAIVICAVIALATRSFGGVSGFTLPTGLYLVYAAVCCTIGGYMMQNVALKHISARTVGMAQCLYPVLTAVGAFFILKEHLTAMGIVGAAVILACVFLESCLKE